MQLDMILEGTTAYVKLPSALTTALQTSGRSWLKLDVAKLAGVPGLSSLASGPTTSNPTQTLQMLESVSGSVMNLGQERVDGFQTTHYRANLSLARLVDGLPSAERSAAQQVFSTLQQALPGGVLPIDVWIDGHRLVRRITTSMDLSLPTGANMQEATTVDFSDYGPQSPPATPPADEVFDATSLLGASG